MSGLSVIVIGYNEGQALTDCLRSVRDQGGDRVSEIIYVDSNSTDDSVERAAREGAVVLRVPQGRLGAALARNIGWRHAKGDEILFLDGDTTLESGFVDRALALMSDPQIVAVDGVISERYPEKSVYQRVLDLDWKLPPGFVESCGGNVMMRRSALEDVGGFDPSLSVGEEPELCRRLRERGFLIYHLAVPMVKHDLAMTSFWQYWKRAFRTGVGYVTVSRRYENTDDPLWARESKSDLLKGLFVAVCLLASMGGSIVLASPIPFLIGMALIAALSLRTALRYRWKSSKWSTLLLWGLHSQLVKIPIASGIAWSRWWNFSAR